MDVFTQGVIGAVTAQSISKKENIRYASIIGFLSGLLADVDVLIRSKNDPLLTLEYHRHFTHSIFFVPVGALIAFIILWPFFKNSLLNKQLYLYCFAGCLFSGFIDACTSYGTHLFWPLIDARISWHIISIVDPVFTGLLLITLIICFKSRVLNYARAGIVLAACYLLLGVIQLNRAESSVIDLAQERGHKIEKIIVKPTIGNIILWRSIYLTGDTFYVDAVRVGHSKKIFEGKSIKKFNFNESFPTLDKQTTLAKDIRRFVIFSDDYVSFHPDTPNILGDVRYSMSPISVFPLWGIEMNIANPEQHVKYEFYRVASKETRQQFMDMLLDRIN